MRRSEYFDLILDYAEDEALLPSASYVTAALLHRFDEEAGHLDLHVSWANTKIQNVGYDVELTSLHMSVQTKWTR